MGTQGSVDGGLLRAAVEGDLSALGVVLVADHAAIRDASEGAELVVGPSAVCGVLRAFRAGEASAGQVQSWASFVRRGYVAGREAGAVSPVDLAYEGDREEAIAQVVARLDELGDAIDGIITAEEINQLLRFMAGE